MRCRNPVEGSHEVSTKKSIICVWLKVKDCNDLSFPIIKATCCLYGFQHFWADREKSYSELNIEAARFDIKLLSPEINFDNQQ